MRSHPPLRLVPLEPPTPPEEQRQRDPPSIVGLTSGRSFEGQPRLLAPQEIWAFQAAGDMTFVHSAHGRFQVEVAFVDIVDSFCRPLLRVHPHWLVDVTHVRAFERESAQVTLFVGVGLGEEALGIRVPVARERILAVRDALLANATGLRPRGRVRDEDE